MADEVAKKKEEPAVSDALVAPRGYQLPQLSEEEMKEISAYFRSHTGGIAQYSPKICTGPACEIMHECPLHQRNLPLPVDSQCFVELNLIRAFMVGMAQDLDIKAEHIFDLHSVGAIAINKVLIKRALDVLAREDLIVDSFRAMTPDGHPIFERKAHPSIAILKDLTKLNQIIQSDLMATRKEKSKDALRKRISPTQAAQDLKKKLAAARKGLAQGHQKLVDHYTGEESEVVEAEFTVNEGGNHGSQQGSQGNGRQDGQDQGREGHREEGQEGQGAAVRGEAISAVREEGQEGGHQEEVIRRDPKTGFLIHGKEESGQEG